MDSEADTLFKHQKFKILQDWIESCRRRGKISRNTVAVAIVVLDHLRQQCPAVREEVISHGGEIKGARSGLGAILEKYGIPPTYLKEATTRQAHQDGQRLFEAFHWGGDFTELSPHERDDLLLDFIGVFTELAFLWLERQKLKIDFDQRHAPETWVRRIVDNAEGISGGVVEQHLVGAKLQRRFKDIEVPNHPARAADQQTSREGDFVVGRTIYHVTASPTRNVIEKCSTNLRVGLHPILLIPAKQAYKARALAEVDGIEEFLTIISIEDFVSMNIIEVAMDESKDFYSVLKEILAIYNERLSMVETDLALQIEMH